MFQFETEHEKYSRENSKNEHLFNMYSLSIAANIVEKQTPSPSPFDMRLDPLGKVSVTVVSPGKAYF